MGGEEAVARERFVILFKEATINKHRREWRERVKLLKKKAS